jgi:hypothetical protein
MDLPDGLLPLAEYSQFILWKLVPAEPKDRKVPMSAITMRAGDPHDPAMWMSFQDANNAADMLDMQVGFVFTEADPFWFLDIDHCLVDGQWSPLANEMMALLPGAAIEVSQSGEGLHLFGVGTSPDHGCKNKSLDMEFYTESRFVALTGNCQSGSADADLGAVLPYLVSKYFPFTEGTLPSDWTTEPCVEWSGPLDDEVLSNKMRSTTSAKAKFGGAASPDDLWTANVSVLSSMYPDNERDFGHSEADAALAQHLAFWTGKDCERIERMMRQSALLRDKWDRRERGMGYLKDTIMKAVGRQEAVYSTGNSPPPVDKAPPPPPSAGTAPPPPVATKGQARGPGMQLMTMVNQIDHFAGCVYIRDLDKIWVPDGGFLKPSQFKATYGGYLFSLDQNDKTTKSAWEVFTESQSYDFPKATCSCFRPELPSGAIIHEEGWKLVNTFSPIYTTRKHGDPSRFLDFMAKLVPDERDRTILISYMASLVQNPGAKFQWCPLIQGCEGNGKTMLSRVLAHCVGHRYTHYPNASDLGGNGQKFNAWILNKLFIGIEEIYTADRSEITEAMKPLITNSRIEIQGKGDNQETGDNRANFMMFSNHKDALRLTADTRRYAIFYTAQQSMADIIACGMDGDYFSDMYNWLRDEGYDIMNDWLRSYAVPVAFDPADKCQRAPQTTSTSEAVVATRGTIEQEIINAIDECRPGFTGGWVSSLALDRLLDHIHASRKVPRSKRKGVMNSLGYDWHPALAHNNGRVNNPVSQEGGKPALYIRAGHISINLKSIPEVVKAFVSSQEYFGVNSGAVAVK